LPSAPRGADPERLVIDVPFEEAVRRALAKPIPPGGVPDKPKRPRRGKGEGRAGPKQKRSSTP